MLFTKAILYIFLSLGLLTFAAPTGYSTALARRQSSSSCSIWNRLFGSCDSSDASEASEASEEEDAPVPASRPQPRPNNPRPVSQPRPANPPPRESDEGSTWSWLGNFGSSAGSSSTSSPYDASGADSWCNRPDPERRPARCGDSGSTK